MIIVSVNLASRNSLILIRYFCWNLVTNKEKIWLMQHFPKAVKNDQYKLWEKLDLGLSPLDNKNGRWHYLYLKGQSNEQLPHIAILMHWKGLLFKFTRGNIPLFNLMKAFYDKENSMKFSLGSLKIMFGVLKNSERKFKCKHLLWGLKK